MPLPHAHTELNSQVGIVPVTHVYYYCCSCCGYPTAQVLAGIIATTGPNAVVRLSAALSQPTLPSNVSDSSGEESEAESWNYFFLCICH